MLNLERHYICHSEPTDIVRFSHKYLILKIIKQKYLIKILKSKRK